MCVLELLSTSCIVCTQAFSRKMLAMVDTLPCWPLLRPYYLFDRAIRITNERVGAVVVYRIFGDLYLIRLVPIHSQPSFSRSSLNRMQEAC